MSTYKQFLSKDVIITPFEVNKRFSFNGAELTGSNVKIDFYKGLNISGTLFNPLLSPKSGLYPSSSQYQKNAYESVKQLYYTNHISSSIPFPNPSSSAWDEFYKYYGSEIKTDTSHRYDNYLSSLLTESRYFPTESNSEISIISIPSKLYGNNITPKTFAFTYNNLTVYDDGNGNLYTPSDTQLNEYSTAQYGINVYGSPDAPYQYMGNIIYSHGIVIITTGSLSGVAGDISSSLTNLTSASISFSSSIELYETQYKCTLTENEFNFSLNPSLVSGSNVIYSGSYLSASTADNSTTYGYVTESYFSPYITTIGLYNNIQELIAVGKLSQPLQKSRTTDTTILINFDK